MKGATRIGRYKTAVGVAVFCALTFSASAASSASAKGLTAYTCVKGKGVLNGPHCLGTSGGEYGHVALEGGKESTGTTTNANTAEETTAARKAILKGTLSGVGSEIQCAGVSGSGTSSNKISAGGEMYVHAEGTLTYTGCEMKAPAGCKVATELTTNKLTTTTEGIQTAEPPHTALIKPAAATPFIEITTSNCTNEGLNQTYPSTGSFKAKISGATLTSLHADITAQNTLKFGGQKAGLDGALTMKVHSNAGEETQPVTFTTE